MKIWNKITNKIMADITMCKGNNCKLSSNCYRYKATQDEYRQSWFVKEPNTTENECEYYWEYKKPKDNKS
jgi:phosphatidylinositol kinase/protein kinase (PI-3  family)